MKVGNKDHSFYPESDNQFTTAFITFLLFVVLFFVPYLPLFNFYAILSLYVSLLLFFVINSKNICYPLTLLLIGSVLLSPVIYFGDRFFVLSYIVLGTTIYYKYWKGKNIFIAVSIIFFAIGVFVYVLYFSPVVRPDAAAYHNIIHEYQSFRSYFTILGEHLLENPWERKSSLLTFPLAYLPLYDALEIHSPEAIIVVNFTLWMATVFMFRELTIGFLETDDAQTYYSADLVAVILFISPSAIHWTGSFLKEVTAVFLSVLAVYLFFRERYVLFLIILFIGIQHRPYTLAVVGIYISIFLKDIRLIIIGFGFSILFVLYYSGTPIILINSALIVPYLLLSPNPLNTGNWMDPFLVPRLIEGIGASVIVLFGFIKSPVTEYVIRQYLILGLSLCIYALIMGAIGYRNITQPEGAYELLVIGENVLRKKFMVLPLISLLISFSIGILRNKYHVSIDINI